MLQRQRSTPMKCQYKQAGFTLVELLIAMFVSGLIMSAVMTVYTAQSKSYAKHDDIAGIQQNLRGALAVLSSEIRMAGCDPTEKKAAGILTATKTQLRFTRDFRGKTGSSNPNAADGDVGDSDEDLAYTLTARKTTNNNNTVTADNNDDGIIDSGGANWQWGSNIIPSIGRQTGGSGGFQPLANNIEALEFSYLLEGSATPVANPSSSKLNKIRAVMITILARASNPADDYVHTSSYTTATGVTWTPPQDHYRRRLVITTIQCRNMGL